VEFATANSFANFTFLDHLTFYCSDQIFPGRKIISKKYNFSPFC